MTNVIPLRAAPDPHSGSESAPAASAKPPLTTERLVEHYLALRARKEELVEKHKAELTPFNRVMERIEGTLLAKLNDDGEDSKKTKAGTAYKTTVTSVTCSRWSETLGFIREHEKWELLEARVSKTAAVAILEEQEKERKVRIEAGEHPAGLQVPNIPGVEVRREIKVNVRKS